MPAEIIPECRPKSSRNAERDQIGMLGDIIADSRATSLGIRTLANLSNWPAALVEGFRTLLKGGIAVAAEGICIRRALPHGHAAAVLGTIGRWASTGCLASRLTSAWRPWRPP